MWISIEAEAERVINCDQRGKEKVKETKRDKYYCELSSDSGDGGGFSSDSGGEGGLSSDSDV